MNGNELRRIADGFDFEPLSPIELRNMLEIITGTIRNMPLRQEQKNMLLFQMELSKLAFDTGKYAQSISALMVVEDILLTFVVGGIISAATAASVLNFINLALEVLNYLNLAIILRS